MQAQTQPRHAKTLQSTQVVNFIKIKSTLTLKRSLLSTLSHYKVGVKRRSGRKLMIELNLLYLSFDAFSPVDVLIEREFDNEIITFNCL